MWTVGKTALRMRRKPTSDDRRDGPSVGGVAQQQDDKLGGTPVPDKLRPEAQAHRPERDTPEEPPQPERDTPEHSVPAKNSQRHQQRLPSAEHQQARRQRSKAVSRTDLS